MYVIVWRMSAEKSPQKLFMAVGAQLKLMTNLTLTYNSYADGLPRYGPIPVNDLQKALTVQKAESPPHPNPSALPIYMGMAYSSAGVTDSCWWHTPSVSILMRRPQVPSTSALPPIRSTHIPSICYS